MKTPIKCFIVIYFIAITLSFMAGVWIVEFFPDPKSSTSAMVEGFISKRRLLTTSERQRILRDEGLYHSPIDDIRGPNTIAAENLYFQKYGDIQAVEIMRLAGAK